MQRRPFLSTAALAAIAGCSTNPNSDGQTESGTERFELVGIEAPDRAPSTAQVRFGIHIRNVGAERRTFSSPIKQKVDDDEWKTVDTVSLALDAGQAQKVQTSQFFLPYLGTQEFQLTAFDETWTVEVHPLHVSFGQAYVIPNGLLISVLGGSFESTYPTTDSTANQTASNQTATPTPTTPADGDVWLIMRVDVRNRLQEGTVQAPEPSQFTLKIAEEPQQQNQGIAVDPYQGGALTSRSVKRGSLVYAVPADTQASEIAMAWSASFSKGDMKAIWSSSGRD